MSDVKIVQLTDSRDNPISPKTSIKGIIASDGEFLEDYLDNTKVSKSGDTMTGKLIVDTRTNTDEADVGSRSNSGGIWIAAQNSATGKRGLYTDNAERTQTPIIEVAQNNSITYGSGNMRGNFTAQADGAHEVISRVSSGSGTLYMYAQENSSGTTRSSRGLYTVNPSGAAIGVIGIDLNNNVNYANGLMAGNGFVLRLTNNMYQSSSTTLTISGILRNTCYLAVIGANGGNGSHALQPNLYILSVTNETTPQVNYAYIGGYNNTAQKITAGKWSNNTLTLTMSAANARVSLIKLF